MGRSQTCLTLITSFLHSPFFPVREGVGKNIYSDSQEEEEEREEKEVKEEDKKEEGDDGNVK